MARNNRPSRRPARRRSRRNTRRIATRAIAHVAVNGPVPVRVPNDPPRRSLTHERHFCVRVQLLYDKDYTGTDTYNYGQHDGTINYKFSKKSTDTSLSCPFTVDTLFKFHKARYGFDAGVALALRSIKAWGPIPPSPLRLRLHALPQNGSAPQTYEDLGTGVNRAKVGFHLPILQWYTSVPVVSVPILAEVELLLDDATSTFYGEDAALGCFDVSLVARNYH